MKTIKYLTMAALALMMTACSSDDNDIITPDQPAKAEGIPFSATITVDNGATTRALAESGTTIEATWADGEKVALIYTVGSTAYKTDATVTKQADNSATISATLQTGVATGDDVTIIYPASAADGTTGNVISTLLAAQDGTLTGTGGTSIAEKYDVRTGSGKLSISDGKATVNNGTPGTPVTLTNQNAIFKFTLKDIAGTNDKAATEFIVKDASNNVITTVTPASATNVLYVALPALATGTYWFNATVDSKPYIAKATVGTATTAGNYYQTTVKMATIGDVILTDGKFAAPSSTEAKAAMIAYIGTDADGSDPINPNKWHGLAIALADANNRQSYAWSNKIEDAGVSTSTTMTDHKTFLNGIADTETLIMKYGDSYAAGGAKSYQSTVAAPAGTSGWFLPSSGQWLKFFEAAGVNVSGCNSWGSFPGGSSDRTKIYTLMEAAKSGSYVHDNYLSSSEYNQERIAYVLFASDALYLLYSGLKTSKSPYVRSFLAF